MLTEKQKEIYEALCKVIREATKTFKELAEVFFIISEKTRGDNKK